MKISKIISGLCIGAAISLAASLPAAALEPIPPEAETSSVLYGDVNLDAKIDLTDAVLLNKRVAGAIQFGDSALANADCNADGSVSLDDSIVLLRFLTHLTDSLPETDTPNRQIEKKIDAIGYSDELLRLATGEKSDAVITSVEELESYLTPITIAQNVEVYLEEYDETFFQDNVLLLNAIYQSCGDGIMYTIDSVTYEGNVLDIVYLDLHEEGPYPCIVNGLLAQVIVPKELFTAVDSVNWIYQSKVAEKEEISWSVETLDYYGSEFDETLYQEYLFTSVEELEGYFDTIYLNDYTNSINDLCTSIKKDYLKKYNESYFKNNVLAMMPISVPSLIRQAYVQNHILYVEYDCTDRIPEDDPTANLMLVTVPKSLYTVSSAVWAIEGDDVELEEISWSVETLDYYSSGFDETTNQDYLFTSVEELAAYFDTILPHDYNDLVNPIKADFLYKYNKSYFENNVLAIKPISVPSLIGQAYVQNHILYVEYDCTDRIPEDDPTANLMLVTVPKSLYTVSSAVWVEITHQLLPPGGSWGGCEEPEYGHLHDLKEFDFASPDESYHFYVSQESMDLNSYLTFYINEDHYEELKCLGTEIRYPFSDGQWGTDADGYDVYSNAGMTSDPMYGIFSVTWKENSVVFAFQTAPGSDTVLEFPYPDRTIYTQTICQEIDNITKPEIVSVDLTADCSGSLQYQATIRDVYAVDYMTSGKTGLVGTPIELTWKDGVSNVHGVFHYDESELRWVSEENLKLMTYIPDPQCFVDVTDAVLDTVNNTVSFDALEQGIYLLVDAKDGSYQKNVTAYISDWERGGYEVGDILALADKEWALSCKGEFHVTNAQELASAVWYANSFGLRTDITLENDIDLTGYDWIPMGYEDCGTGNPYVGTVNGNGYAIQNMTINSKMYYVGFIGTGNCKVNNLTFENASVSGGTCTGIVCGYCLYPALQQVHLTGTVTSSGRSVGAFVGNIDSIVEPNSINEPNCTCDVVVNGERVEKLLAE